MAFPLSINNSNEIRQHYVNFKQYMGNENRYGNPSLRIFLTGAGLFVDFLCGIELEQRNSGNTYKHYPEKPWPSTAPCRNLPLSIENEAEMRQRWLADFERVLARIYEINKNNLRSRLKGGKLFVDFLCRR